MKHDGDGLHFELEQVVALTMAFRACRNGVLWCLKRAVCCCKGYMLLVIPSHAWIEIRSGFNLGLDLNFFLRPHSPPHRC